MHAIRLASTENGDEVARALHLQRRFSPRVDPEPALPTRFVVRVFYENEFWTLAAFVEAHRGHTIHLIEGAPAPPQRFVHRGARGEGEGWMDFGSRVVGFYERRAIHEALRAQHLVRVSDAVFAPAQPSSTR